MRKGKVYGVRCLCHPEAGTRYVGQTVKSIQSRRNVHLWNSKTEASKSYNSYFSNWIRKHGEENVVFYELEEVPVEFLDSREDWWICYLRKKGRNLTNIKRGGGSARGYKRPRQSELMSGENNPMYGRNREEEMAYARSFQGPPSEKTKALWREQRKGEGNSRAVLTDEVIRELRKEEKRYGLFSEWARRYGVTPQTIHSAYHGKTWKHVD